MTARSVEPYRARVLSALMKIRDSVTQIEATLHRTVIIDTALVDDEPLWLRDLEFTATELLMQAEYIARRPRMTA